MNAAKEKKAPNAATTNDAGHDRSRLVMGKLDDGPIVRQIRTQACDPSDSSGLIEEPTGCCMNAFVIEDEISGQPATGGDGDRG